jgi:hypothetical protein
MSAILMTRLDPETDASQSQRSRQARGNRKHDWNCAIGGFEFECRKIGQVLDSDTFAQTVQSRLPFLLTQKLPIVPSECTR